MNKTLVHSALLCECQNLINYYKLKQDKSVTNFKLYTNDKIIIAACGIGKEKTIASLEEIFQNYKIDKAINIGTAGCKDENINIGELFCTNKNIEGIKKESLTTVDVPLNDKSKLQTTLVDMEAKYFEQVCSKYNIDFTVLKVVSDHLDTTIPKKSFIIELMTKSFKKWEHLI